MHLGLTDTLSPEQRARILIGKKDGRAKMLSMAKGINVYELVRDHFGTLDESVNIREEASSKWPCIFLAHLSDEEEAVCRVAEYIMDAGINFYLDVGDPSLQAAVLDENAREITRFIERGIRSSSHLLAFLTADTMSQTWWVPFEIGFAKRDGKRLACLKLREVEFGNLSFLSIVKRLEGIRDLNNYLAGVSRLKKSPEPLRFTKSWLAYSLSCARAGGRSLLHSGNPEHPLRRYLEP